MEKIVELKELRENTETYINAVEKGQSFIVIRRNLPIFKLSPVEESDSWETVADFTKIKKGGVDINEILSRI